MSVIKNNTCMQLRAIYYLLHVIGKPYLIRESVIEHYLVVRYVIEYTLIN
jgi:hypothetical protein